MMLNVKYAQQQKAFYGNCYKNNYTSLIVSVSPFHIFNYNLLLLFRVAIDVPGSFFFPHSLQPPGTRERVSVGFYNKISFSFSDLDEVSSINFV